MANRTALLRGRSPQMAQAYGFLGCSQAFHRLFLQGDHCNKQDLSSVQQQCE